MNRDSKLIELLSSKDNTAPITEANIIVSSHEKESCFKVVESKHVRYK